MSCAPALIVFAMLWQPTPASSRPTDSLERMALLGRQGGGQYRLFLAFNCRDDDSRLTAALVAQPIGMRNLLDARLALCASYRPTLPRATDPDDKFMVEAHRTLERALVVFTGRTDLSSEAVAYARDAVLFYEWEGLPEGPLDEAAYAQQYLERHPTTALKPYLQLFLLYRYRAAYEAADWSAVNPPNGVALDRVVPRWREMAARASDGYRKMWADVQRSGDPLTKLVAEDIDRAPQLYVGPAGHPRTAKGGGPLSR